MKTINNKYTLFQGIADSKLTIFCDEFDIKDFEEVKSNSDSLLALSEKGKKEYMQFPELQQDIYSSLVRLKPLFLEEKQIRAGYLLNKEIISLITNLPRYKEVRVFTVADRIISTIATESLSEEALKILQKIKRERQLFGDYLNALLKIAELEGEGTGEGEGNDGDGNVSSTSTKRYTLEEAKQKAAEYYNKFKETIRQKETQAMFSQMVANVLDRVREESDFIEAWGLGSSGTYSQRPYHEKVELVRRLRSSPKLKQIAQLAGRFKRIALQRQKEKIKKGTDEVYSITQGNDLSRLLPSEIIKLSDPIRRKEFMLNFIEGKCLQYDLRGKARKAKGAIVIAIDNSGSMFGEPEIWAKAVAMALLEIAIMQKRNFFCIHFSSGTSAEHLKVQEFPKGVEPDIEKIIEMAEYFESGGTEFQPPLDRARTAIDKEPNYSKADIIFVTDGESAVTDPWLEKFLEWKKSNKVNLTSILINSYHSTDLQIKEFSDDIHELTDLKIDQGSNTAISIFDSI